MTRESKYRVWCEFEIDGEHHQEMQSDAGWFLLSQTGQIMSYGPMGDFDPNAAQKYTKLVPLFWTGLHDRNGKAIYDKDLFKDSTGVSVVEWNEHFASWCLRREGWLSDHFFGEAVEPDQGEVLGNVFQNPELLSSEVQR